MKQGKLIRRAVSVALAGCMMFTLSAPALAASTDDLLQQSTAAKSAVSVLDEENDMTAEPAYQMNLKDGSITVYIGANGKQYVQQGDNEAQQRGNLQITTDGSTTPNTLTIQGGTIGAKVTLYNANINASGAAVSVSGNVKLVIEGTNTLHSGTDHAGVEKADDDGTLTISGSGTLNAYGGQGGAGIGSGSQKGCSNIVIESGTIIAHGGQWGAGIGSGNVGGRPGMLGGSNITINDGDVTAYGGSEAAGIGGGFKGNGKDITINGGTVRAESYDETGSTAAIGGGRWDGKGENIQITGGDVTVKSGTGVWIGGTNGEISKSSLTGAVTYQDGSGSVVDEVVQDYGLEVGAENSTPTRVTSKNYKDILDKGVLSYDPTTQTLKSNGKLPRSLQKINAPDKDIELKGENSSTVTDKLIVKNAHNVTISSDKFAAIFTKDDTSTINCTGKVAIRSNEDMAVNGSLNIDGSSEVTLSAGSSVVKNSANITSDGDVTIESTDGRAAEKLTINKAQNVTITISDDERAVSEDTKITASGTVILKNTAEGGRVGTVDFTQANGKAYVYYISDEPDAKLIDLRIHPLAEAAGESYLRIEPRETTYSITVANGTAQVDDDITGLNTAFEGEKVTVKANAPTDEDAAKGVKFHHWKVEEGNISVDPTAGSLGSATEAGTEEISFDMPKGNVKLTAVYSIPASVLRNTVTVEGGKAKSTLGEGSGISAEIGTKVEISADTEEHPDKVFVKWEIVYPENFPENVPEELQLKLEEPNRAKTTFEMPAYPVKLIAHWSAIDPDESLAPGAGYDASSAAGGAIAAVAVGGAAIWGGYEIATRVILHNLLPEGAAIPANRGQLALLVWNTAGRPESAGAPAFADVADPDMAKAAQWCTEQGIMDAKGDRFEPEGWTPKFKVIEVWNKAFPKQ